MRPYVFDDQPLDALLYGAPEAPPQPPTQASLYPEAAPWLARLQANLDAGDQDAWRNTLLALTRQGICLPPPYALDCVRRLCAEWGIQPCPKFPDDGFPYAEFLRPLFDLHIQDGAEQLARECGDLLVRWYESHRQHREAIAVLQAQLGRARRDDDTLEQARDRKSAV
jgi:hypothetical protein